MLTDPSDSGSETRPANPHIVLPTPRIAFVTSEYAPLVKTGGLGDVAGALPRTLRELGLDVRPVIPGYPSVLSAVRIVAKAATIEPLARLPSADLLEVILPGGVPGWVVCNEALYARAGGPYLDANGNEWLDNASRFGLLSRAAAWLADAESVVGWAADVIHANDWQAGLAPAFAVLLSRQRAATIMTIHNLAFQGVFDPHWVNDLGLPPASFSINGVEYHGRLSFLKAGLYYADAITTVSPTYAEEIQQSSNGRGLEGLLAARSDVLSGILNGIDIEIWNPRTDPFLARTYDEASLDGKADNKRALQLELGLDAKDNVFLLGAVTRLSQQKGIDLLIDLAHSIAALPAQLVILGAGDPAIEHELRRLHAALPSSVVVVIGFDEALAHRIEGGADAFVMPSRFEPCGLNQMYSQRYGTPPIVHATGGLADSVVDCTQDSLSAGTATGFAYREESSVALLTSIRRAYAVYQDRASWRHLQRNGMARNFGWTEAAASYGRVYQQAIVHRQ